MCGLDRPAGFGRTGFRHRADRQAGGGIDDIDGGARIGLNPFTIDEIGLAHEMAGFLEHSLCLTCSVTQDADPSNSSRVRHRPILRLAQTIVVLPPLEPLSQSRLIGPRSYSLNVPGSIAMIAWQSSGEGRQPGAIFDC